MSLYDLYWEDACVAWVHAPLTSKQRDDLFYDQKNDSEFVSVVAMYGTHTKYVKAELHKIATDTDSSVSFELNYPSLMLKKILGYSTDDAVIDARSVFYMV